MNSRIFRYRTPRTPGLYFRTLPPSTHISSLSDSSAFQTFLSVLADSDVKERVYFRVMKTGDSLECSKAGTPLSAFHLAINSSLHGYTHLFMLVGTPMDASAAVDLDAADAKYAAEKAKKAADFKKAMASNGDDDGDGGDDDADDADSYLEVLTRF